MLNASVSLPKCSFLGGDRVTTQKTNSLLAKILIWRIDREKIFSPILGIFEEVLPKDKEGNKMLSPHKNFFLFLFGHKKAFIYAGPGIFLSLRLRAQRILFFVGGTPPICYFVYLFFFYVL